MVITIVIYMSCFFFVFVFFFPIKINACSLLSDRYNNYCCILTCKTLPHKLCNNNITDVAQEAMLHMQHVTLPHDQVRCLAYNKSVEARVYW